MSQSDSVNRRAFLGHSLTAASAAGIAAAARPGQAADNKADNKSDAKPAAAGALPCGKLGKARISRLMLGGNLISGFMHSRDLKYVNALFRAYATEERIIETLRLAEQNGINTVFETGAKFVKQYNDRYHGHMQFIPHIQVKEGQSDESLRTHIQAQVDSGAVALYVWGVAADTLIKAGAIRDIARAVEMAKKHDLPVGVGGHSLQVPMQCEKHGVPCDFYVKTLHSDDYFSATPKELRKEFIWLDGGQGWNDNMWCINPEETIAFMQSVTKPWELQQKRDL